MHKQNVDKAETYGKFRQSLLKQVPLNDPVVSCKRTRLALIREITLQLRLPKWEAVRLLQRVGSALSLCVLVLFLCKCDYI